MIYFCYFSVGLFCRQDCYIAQMRINGVAADDGRTYYLVVENERGQLRSPVKLTVSDPISMGAVIGIAISGLVLAVVFLLGLVYSRRKRSCCFRDRGHFRPEDIVRIERRKETAASSEGGSSSEDRPVNRPDSPLNPSSRPDIGILNVKNMSRLVEERKGEGETQKSSDAKIN